MRRYGSISGTCRESLHLQLLCSPLFSLSWVSMTCKERTSLLVVNFPYLSYTSYSLSHCKVLQRESNGSLHFDAHQVAYSDLGDDPSQAFLHSSAVPACLISLKAEH